MKHEIAEIKGFNVTGIARRLSNDDPTAIGEHWQRFMSEPFRDVVAATDNAVYSVYFDYAGDHMQPYMLLLGYRTADDSRQYTGLITHTLPAQEYAVLHRTGPMPQTVVEAWKEVWASHLKRAYTGDFDRYPSPDTVEVHVGIL